MDALDASILREMLGERVLFWGTLDPRLKAEAIARRLRVAPTTVRARVRAWRERGFLLRHEVVPHPGHLGLSAAFTSVRVADARSKVAALAALRGRRETLAVLDHVGEWLGVAIVRASTAHEERVRRAIAAMRGVEEALPCQPLPSPPLGPQLTALDWRIVAALRRAPEASLQAAARDVGVSRKTLAARYARLVARRSAWFAAVVDFARWEGGVARFIVTARDARAARPHVLGSIRRMAALLDFERLPPPPASPIVADAFLQVPSAAQAEDVQRALLDLPGVDGVEVLLPRAYEVRGAWADEALASPAALTQSRGA